MCENVTLTTAINMCRDRSNRTDEWRPFLARNAKGGDDESQGDQTGDKRRGVKARRNKRRERRETFLETGCDSRASRASHEARILGRGMRARRKRGEQLLSCQRWPLNLPADLFTIVPCPPVLYTQSHWFRLLVPCPSWSFSPRYFVISLRFFAASSKMIIVRGWRRDGEIDIDIIFIES